MVYSADFILFQLTNLLVRVLFVIIIPTNIIAMPGNCSHRGGFCFDCSTEKRSLPHKACSLSIKQRKCLEGLCAESIGQYKRHCGHCMPNCFQESVKYHNKGRFLSRYLKENSSFHFANINREILQVLSAKCI